MWLDRLWLDVRYGTRGLVREPTFALTAILTLALGIATTTTVFSVVDAELWRPLPYPQPDRLIAVYTRDAAGQGPIQAMSGAELQQWRAGAPALAGLAAQVWGSRRILRLETAQSVVVAEVTANFYDTLGQAAAVGRMFSASDATGGRRALLTDRAWRRLFASDPSIPGRTIIIDDEVFVVTGVAKADDPIGVDHDVFVSIDETAAPFLDWKRLQFHGGIGRLRPGVDAAVAQAQLQAVVTRLVASSPGGTARKVFVEDLRKSFTGFNWRPLYFFLAASLVVLLLSAVNVATLLVARAFRRTREFALRGALGGGEAALIRQLLMEGALVALPAALAAVLLARWATRLFTNLLPSDFFARGTNIPIDFRVFGFALAVTGVVTAVFALAPLVSARRVQLAGALGPGTRAGRAAAESRARNLLLTAQIALTVVLLSGAGIFLKSFTALTRVPMGFDPENAIAIRAVPSGPRYEDVAAVRVYAEEMLAAVRAIPGVRDAAVGTSSPLGSGPVVNFVVAGTPLPGAGQAPRAILRSVGPGYFRTLGIRLVRGREFRGDDVAGSPRVAVVNEAAARELFGYENPIGRVIEVPPGGRGPEANRPGVPGAHVIVGVSSNVKDTGLNEIEFGNLYLPFAQAPSTFIEVVARAGVPAVGMVEPLRKAAASVDPSVPVTRVATLDARVNGVLQEDRFNLLLISGFAVVALLLAGVGVYGSVAYHVQARTRELGVRLALGARPGRLVGAALWSAARVGTIGGVCGLAAALGLAKIIGNALYLVPLEHSGLLYGVTTTDPQALAGAFVGMLILVVAAGAIPARRVARVDPVVALRNE
jgi:putative ABC transport system permease protein